MREVLAAFERAAEADLLLPRSKAIEKWRKKLVAPPLGTPCQFCGQVSDGPLELAPLLSTEIGGRHRSENLLAACEQCKARAQVADWIAWKGKPRNLTPALAARRLEVLSMSENHLLRTRDEARTKPYVVKLLHRRWQYLRFVLRACLTEHGGLLAFAQHTPMPEGIATLIRLRGGQSVRSAPRVFQIEAAGFLDLVWLLIDHNALVRRVTLDEFPDPTPADDGASRWHETYQSVNDITRRAKSRRGLVAPSPWHEKPMDPRTRRHLAALMALRTNQPLDEEWLAKHRETDDVYLRLEREGSLTLRSRR